MTSLIESGHQPLFIDSCYDAVDGILAGGINNCELLAEVAENGGKQAESVGDNDINALLVTVFTNSYLGLERCVCEDNDLILVEFGQILGDAIAFK